jgi:hypothetical protein
MSVPSWGMGKQEKPLGASSHVLFRSILAGGRIRGFWEFDPDAREVATHLFDPPAKAVRAAIDAAAADTSAFLRDQLGHGRSFSLDDDKELRRRTAQLRAMARKG